MARKHIIAVNFTNARDHELVTSYLASLGYEPVDLADDAGQAADLYLLDAPAACRVGESILALKKASEVFLPVIVALKADDTSAAWLDAGFDDCIRMPVSKVELRNRVEILLRLRRQAEALAEKSEIRYKAIFEATGTATLLVDEDTTILMANRECLPVTGYAPEELIGTKWTSYVAPESLEIMLSRHEARRRDPDGVPGKYEAKLVNKNGEIRDAILDAAMVPGTAQSVVSMLDITERKQAELAGQRRLQAIEQADEVVVITDPTGAIQYVNPAFEKSTGYCTEEVVGQNPRILKSGRQDAAFYRQMWDTLTSGKTWRGRMVNRRKDGTLYTEEATISPVFGPDGELVNYVGVKRDITEQLRLAEERDQLQERLNQAQKMEAIGRLAGGVAHDFNNMLSVILGYGNHLVESLRDGDPLRMPAQQIVEAGQRSAALTRQLLAFSRKQTLQPAVLDVNELVANLHRMLERLIGEDIALVLALADDLWPVRVDAGQIEQVLINLAVNARDAMPDGGKLIIETANVELDERYASTHADVTPGSHVMLAVTDNGCGMDEETVSKIFDPFFTTKEKGKGTGLGLATVYGIVKQSGGNIWAYSEPGHGTTFKIYLPMTADKPEAVAPAERVSAAVRGGEHILVVEDEEALRGLLESTLSQQGFGVSVAANGGEALLLVEEQGLKPDLLITDVVMPGMSGSVLVERLRRNLPDLKVLYMSGYTDNAIVHHGVLDPGTPYIQKPFTTKEITKKIRQLCNPRR